MQRTEVYSTYCGVYIRWQDAILCFILGAAALLDFSAKRVTKVFVCLLSLLFSFFAFVCLQYFGANYVAALFCKKVSTDDNWARRRLRAALRC